MIPSEGKKQLDDLRKKWIIVSFTEAALIAFTIAVLSTVLIVQFFQASFWIGLPVFLGALILVSLFKKYWKISSLDVSRYLDNRFPELQESTGLILKPAKSLSLLEQFQVAKVNQALQLMPPVNDHIKKLKSAVFLLLAGIIISAVVSKTSWPYNTMPVKQQGKWQPPAAKETILPQISSYTIGIDPPAYTGNPKREQKQFSIKAEAGATIKWIIETNATVKSLRFIFNGQEDISARSAGGNGSRWAFSRVMHRSGFYQLNVNGKLSDLYQVEIVPDQPVSIKITSPAELHNIIDFGQALRVKAGVSLLDDYGIRETYISATIASGKGESVSFKEQRIAFDNSPRNGKQFVSGKTIDLSALGMNAGDELYFFVKAVDNHGQESRSDIYFVSVQDTSELMDLAGLAGGVNPVPEYFRSQRQIIIDTEKLLKEKLSISLDDFHSRSNNLGIDQKLLRLRYGKFLGEENETNIGGDHEEEDGSGEPAVFGDTKAILDKFTHHTDNAEDATFYEPQLKARLKATLTEMWNSELRLRTYKPQDALPYEYKALRLLKELQQSSRAYVAKTTVKVSALKPEKRLSGQLDKITQPVKIGSAENIQERPVKLKTTLALLESLKAGSKMVAADRLLLMRSESYLLTAAAQHPKTYLPALKGIKNIRSATSSSIQTADIDLAENGIRKLLGAEKSVPKVQSAAVESSLSRLYFNNLKKLNR